MQLEDLHIWQEGRTWKKYRIQSGYKETDEKLGCNLSDMCSGVKTCLFKLEKNNDLRVWMETLNCLSAKWKYIKMSSEKQRNTKFNQAEK